MRIIINDIAASTGGAMSILKQFYQFIKENDKHNEWIFLLGNKYLEETENIKILCFPKVKNNHIIKILFDCFYGKKIIEKYNPDVVVSLQNIITFGLKTRQIVYIHQSIPFQSEFKFSFVKKKERKIAFIQNIIGKFIIQSAKRADKVVVQTNWMKFAVSKKAKINLEKIIVDFPLCKVIPTNKNNFCKRKFIYPTSTDIYKNINAIVEACDYLNRIGIDDFEVKLTIPEGYIKHQNIICVGYLSPDQLQNEYQNSTLIFPSYIETIGLPLVEAKLMGTLILSSDTIFAHEVLYEYNNSYFFDPFNSIELGKLMEKIINEKILLKDTLPSKETKKINNNAWNNLYKEIINSIEE